MKRLFSLLRTIRNIALNDVPLRIGLSRMGGVPAN